MSRNARNGESGKNSPKVWPIFILDAKSGSLEIGDYKECNENQRTPAKVLTKIQMTWQRARPLKTAILTKMANVAKICQGLDYMSNKKAKGLPDK